MLPEGTIIKALIIISSLLQVTDSKRKESYKANQKPTSDEKNENQT
jgi:hypothetical protein